PEAVVSRRSIRRPSSLRLGAVPALKGGRTAKAMAVAPDISGWLGPHRRLLHSHSFAASVLAVNEQAQRFASIVSGGAPDGMGPRERRIACPPNRGRAVDKYIRSPDGRECRRISGPPDGVCVR